MMGAACLRPGRLPGALAVVLLAVSSLVPARDSRAAEAYPDAPPRLRQLADQKAAGFLAREARSGSVTEATEGLFDEWETMVALAVTDAVRPKETSLLSKRYQAENDRTDKQPGASATGGGTTSLAEKPGIPMWLSIALERGALEQSVSANSATFSGSAYSISRMLPIGEFGEATQDLFSDLGISATYPLDGGDGGGMNLDRVTEWSVRWQVFGGRSTMQRSFARDWERAVRPALQAVTDDEVELMETALGHDPDLGKARDAAESSAKATVLAYRTKHARLAETDAHELSETLLGALHSHIYEPARSGTFVFSEVTRGALAEALVKLERDQQQMATARAAADRAVEAREKNRILTLECTDHRDSSGADLTEGKILFMGRVAKQTDLVANLDVAYFRDRPAAISEKNRKDLSLAISLESKRDNPFRKDAASPSSMPVSMTARFAWPKGHESDRASCVLQLSTQLPLGTGLMIPLSVSWANRTELIKERQVGVHLGITIDTDKLLAIANLSKHAVPDLSGGN